MYTADMTSGETMGQPHCAASQLAELVDQQINDGARREFAEATDRLQQSGADLGEGSAYTDDSSAYFTPKTLDCGLCMGEAYLSAMGSIRTDACRLSGMCEFEWAKKYPDEYGDLQQNPEDNWLICAAEIGCYAIIAMKASGDSFRPTVKKGICEIARRGNTWRERLGAALRAEDVVDPEDGIPIFDGDGSGREA